MNIIRTLEDLQNKYDNTFSIQDDTLESIRIMLLPHYGHLVCLCFSLTKYKHAIHNDTRNIGAILHHFCYVLNVREDGDFLDELSQAGKHVRSIWVEGPAGRECVGIGHYWKDEFILFDEFYLAEV